MKKNPNLFSKTIVKYLAIALISLVAVNCTKKEDPATNIFRFGFAYYDSESDYVDVSFATTGSEIPDVEVNGTKIPFFEVYGNLITGSIYIPFDETIEYSVKANGKTTSGTIDMPEFVDQIECNNTDVYESDYNVSIYQASKYNFKWDAVDCDYQIFYCDYATPEINELLEPEVSKFTLNDKDLSYNSSFSVELNLINGDRLIAGTSPSVSGNYGDGYVTASSNSYFVMSLYSNDSSTNKSVVKNQKHSLSREERKAIFLEQFQKVCNQK